MQTSSPNAWSFVHFAQKQLSMEKECGPYHHKVTSLQHFVYRPNSSIDKMPTGDMPPAAISNYLLLDHTRTQHDGCMAWWSCEHCATHDGIRSNALAYVMPHYLRCILAEHPLHIMAFSFLEVPLTATCWVQSFWKFQQGSIHLMPLPPSHVILCDLNRRQQTHS